VTGLKTAAIGWLAAAGAVTVWQGLISIYADFLGLTGIAAVLGAIATILTAVPLIGVGIKRWWLGFRRAKQAVATILRLDKKVDAHQREARRQWKAIDERFREGGERMASIEARLDAFATAERAAVRGALEAATAPRPPRRTDPAPRDGWRE
jgi:hypothetical protein